MAEEIEIIIGADTTNLNAELTKSQNLLKQFEAALKKSTNAGEINYLTGQVDKLKQSIASLSQAQVKSVQGSAQAAQSLQNLSRIAQDAPFGFIGIANNINPLVESFGRLKAETGSTGGALKALVNGLSGAGGLGLAFSAVTAAITFAQIGFSAWNRTAKQTKETADETAKALESITGELAKEATQVTSFIAVLNNESESRERKLSALKELKQINPEIFGDLDLEKGKVAGLTEAYNVYIESLKSTITAKILQGRLEKELTNLINLQGGALTESEKGILNIGKAINSGIVNNLKQFGSEGANAALKVEEINTALDRNKQKNIDDVKVKIAALTAELTKLSGSIKLPPIITKEQKDKVEKAAKAVETFNDVILKTVKNIADQKDLSIILDESTIKDQIKIVRDAIERGVKDFNQPGNDQRILVLKALLTDLEAQQAVEDASNKIQKKAKSEIGKGKLTITPGVIVNPDVSISKELAASVESAINIIGVGLGETLGAALSGSVNFTDIFRGVFNQLGGVITALGEQVIKIGIAAILAKKAVQQALSFLNPYAAVAAGVALVALGALIKNTTSQQRFAVGTRNAPGGIALVGERGPELINLPSGSQVIPAAQTSNMLGGVGGGIEIYGILRGQDIYFSNKKYSATYARTT